MNTEGPTIDTEPLRKNLFRRGRMKRDLAALLLALAIPVTGCAALGIGQEAPSDTGASDSGPSDTGEPGTGPELTVSADELAAAFDCFEGPGDSEAAPALLIPPTLLTADETFSWNHLPWLNESRTVCTIEPPENSTADMQVSAEYVTHAIRSTYEQHGAEIDVLGFSQGGVLGRAALRFWPDTRGMVDDLVTLGSPHHGSTATHCTTEVECPPALWQMDPDAQFITELNSSQETFAEVSTTSILSTTDDTVHPATTDESGASVLAGENVRNVAVQELCADNESDHLMLGTTDPVAAALALDAFDNPGPADPERITDQVCAAQAPQVDAETAAEDLERLAAAIGETLTGTPTVAEEPRFVLPTG